MTTNRKTHVRFHALPWRTWSAVFFSAFSLMAFAGTTNGNSIEASQVEEQPNLMILLSNSASMSENIESNGYAAGSNGTPVQNQCAANYKSSEPYISVPAMNDASTGACGTDGSYFRYGTYGNLPTSKFYIAKQDLYELLKNGAANGINLGFATYRQAFGMQLATVQSETNAIYPYIYLPNQTPGEPSSAIGGESFTTLSNIANNPDNFGYVDWWTVYNSYAPNGTGNGFSGNTDAFLGNGMNNKFQSAGLFGPVSYLQGVNGEGLPDSVQFPAGTLQNSNVNSGKYQYSSYGPGGLTPAQVQAGDEEPDLKLCQTYYNSQENAFQAIYAANYANGQPDVFQQSFPSLYNPNQLFYDSLNYPQFVNGQINANTFAQKCNVSGGPSSVLISNAYVEQTGQFANGQTAYFSYIPNSNSGMADYGGSLNLPMNAASGWSGATTVGSNGDITASYPSTPQSESILGSYDLSGAKWMGSFVNLPSPNNPVNNAPVIENLIDPEYPMENADGTEYSYSQQTITGSNGAPRSIANSSESASYNGQQEPLYNALIDAYAYWSAFEQTDTQAQCQDNNMLILFDGVSDGDPNLTPAQEENALIREAQALYNNLHVKIFVIVIATNKGAINEANKLAAAGGTNTAFTVDSSGALYSDIKETLINISHEKINAALSTTPTVQNGSQEFAVVDVAKDKGQGDLVAYNVTSNGGLNAPTALTPLWNANSIMSTAARQNTIMTTNVSDPGGSYVTSGPETSLKNLASNDPGDFQIASGSGLTAATVADYTINPSYDSGAYLGGRQNGWWIGLPAENAPTIITPPDNGVDIAASGYTAFAGAHANRQNAVAFADNDGLVYAVGFNESTTQPDPQLLWAWMPNGLLPQLQGYSSFWEGGNQNGGLTELDAVNSQGVWHSYVVGSAQDGNILYDLQLSGKNEPMLNDTVAEYNLADAGYTVTQPITGKPAIWVSPDGTANAAWTLNGYKQSCQCPGSDIPIMNVASGSLMDIDFERYAFPAMTSMPVFGDNGSLYFASGSTVYEIPSSEMNTFYQDEKPVGQTPEIVYITTSQVQNLGDFAPFPSGVDTNITRLKLAYSGGSIYMIATTSQGMSVWKQTNGAWEIQWYTSTQGAETWKGTSLVPAPTTGTDAILPIPASGNISDAPQVADSSIILPVSVLPTGDVCGLTTAEYILYNLNNGIFPSGVFAATDSGKALSQVIDVGYGNAYTPSLSAFYGKALLQGSASNTNASKVFEASIVNGLPIGGAVQSRYVW